MKPEIRIEVFKDRGMDQNCYLCYCDNEQGIVIDPAGGEPALSAFVNKNGIRIKEIVLTHGHFDHVLTALTVQSWSGARISCHADEKPLLIDPELNLSRMGLGYSLSIEPDVLYKDGDVLQIGEHRLTVIHTPGHTAGSMCLYNAESHVLFTGDTLFDEAYGRTDFPTGDTQTLMASLNRLFALPGETVIYPGHGGHSDITHQRAYFKRI